jgi:hypothetical protein
MRQREYHYAKNVAKLEVARALVKRTFCLLEREEREQEAGASRHREVDRPVRGAVRARRPTLDGHSTTRIDPGRIVTVNARAEPSGATSTQACRSNVSWLTKPNAGTGPYARRVPSKSNQ